MVVDTLSSVDESVLVSVNSDGDGCGGAGLVGWWSQRVISDVCCLGVVSVSSKRFLALRVRSGVGVDSRRDRIGSIEECCQCQKKSGRLPSSAAYTNLDWIDKINLSSLHKSENYQLLQCKK